MSTDTIKVHTFLPGDNARGENGPAFDGNLRKGELRGIIHINKDNCVGCDTCRKFCPVDAIKGGLGAKHEIVEDACLYCGQCLIARRSRFALRRIRRRTRRAHDRTDGQRA